MSVVVCIDSSSDEEINFFPVAKPKQTDSDDGEVIYCGSNITEKSDDKFKPISYLKGRDVTIQSVGKKKPSSNSNSDHDDVEFLGYVSKSVDKSCSLTKVRKTARSRPQSNVNININSEKSTNNLISIDIEDADSNQKKVKLTFLGPSRRQSYNSVSSNKTPVFNPKSTSSPKNQNNNFSNVVKNQRSIAPRAVLMGDTPSRVSQKSNAIVNQPSKSQLNRSDNNRNLTSLFPAKTVIHNFKIPKIGDKNVSKSQTGCKFDSQGRVLKKAVLNESSQEALNRFKNKLIQAVQNTTASKISNSPAKENKIVSKNKSLIKATEKSIKHPESFSLNNKKLTVDNKATEKLMEKPESCGLNNKNLTVDNQIKTIERSKATSKDETAVTEIKSTSSLDENSNLKKKKISPTKIESKTDTLKRKESAVRSKSPEPSTSGIGSKQAPQSSGSESEDSRYDSSSDIEPNKPSMEKSDLDKLFNQFLDHCSQNYSRKEVSVLISKLRKLYKKSTKVEENEDFIITLKEANLKVENKSIRCPLGRMKQVQAQLRKNSPDNIHNIMRLENVLKEINKKIKKLEEAEVTSDEEECNNNYITLERYQKRAVKIYEKICELSSLPADAERATLRNVSFLGSAPSEFSKSKSIQGLVNKVSHALEKYYNKCRKFPDFNDVNILMNKLSVELSIKIKPTTLTQLAKSIFVEFGNMLQRRRLHDDYRICMEYLGSDEEDPYHYDPILAAKLDENRKSRKKEQHVLDKFCLKQIALKEKDYLDDSESSSSSNESEADRRKKKSKKRRDKSENEDSDSSGNFNAKQNITDDKCDDTNDSSNDSSYTKKKSSKKKRKRTRTSSESSSGNSSSSVKGYGNKRHKSKNIKNKLVRDKSQDNSSDNDSKFKKIDKPITECMSRVQDSKLPNDTTSENDAPLNESDSVKGIEIIENRRTDIEEIELIGDKNEREMEITEHQRTDVEETQLIEGENVRDMEITENQRTDVEETQLIEDELVNEMGKTDTNVKEIQSIENECVEEVEIFEIDSADEMETVENESVKEMGAIEDETVVAIETIEDETVVLIETIEDATMVPIETVDESVKETETIENGNVKENDTIENESVKLTDTVEDDSVKETEAIGNETTIKDTLIENNEGIGSNNGTNQEGDVLETDNDIHFESVDTNSTDGVTEETENNEENETGDQGNLSIQIVNVQTCSQPFTMSQDEDTCESESNEKKVQLAVTGITDTIELSDDDDEDCVLVSEEKKTVLTEQEVMELIPLIFDKKFN